MVSDQRGPITHHLPLIRTGYKRRMAVIRPFKGIRYNQSQVDDLSAVVTPPYDVISADDRRWYMDRHPHNVVRLILPEDDVNKYVNSATTLREWLKDGVLVQDDEPCIYAYQQEFEALGRRMKRTGFTCLIKLEDFGQGVLPHENILAKPMEDRLNLHRATRANFESIFGLFADGKVNSILAPFIAQAPCASAVDRDGVRSDLWRISDADAIRALTEILANEQVVIADGHHRYTAGLMYRNEMRRAAGLKPGEESDAPYDYTMMTMVSLEDSGLVVLPTHRLVRNVPTFDPASFLAKLGEMFDITEVSDALIVSAVELAGSHSFGLHLRGKSYVVKLKPSVSPERAIEAEGSVALKRLDVSVLHSLILDRLLGIGARQMSAQSNLSYTRDVARALADVDRGEYQAFFLMNPTKVDEVKAVAAAGDRMPQKSTFFYPKLLTGIVMRAMPRLDASR